MSHDDDDDNDDDDDDDDSMNCIKTEVHERTEGEPSQLVAAEGLQ